MWFVSTLRCWPLRPGCGGPKQAEAGRGEAKDTLRNIRDTREFVVNIVTYEVAEAMNLTSGEYDASVNEFELAKLTPQASTIVRPPRVDESPVSFECRLHQILDFSPAPTSGSLVIGQIVSIHMNDAHSKTAAWTGIRWTTSDAWAACSTPGRPRDLRW